MILHARFGGTSRLLHGREVRRSAPSTVQERTRGAGERHTSGFKSPTPTRTVRINGREQRALSCRRTAKGLRVTSIVMWAIAAAEVIFAGFAFATGHTNPGITILLSAVVMAGCGVSVRLSAASLDDTAKTWDSLTPREHVDLGIVGY